MRSKLQIQGNCLCLEAVHGNYMQCRGTVDALVSRTDFRQITENLQENSLHVCPLAAWRLTHGQCHGVRRYRGASCGDTLIPRRDACRSTFCICAPGLLQLRSVRRTTTRPDEGQYRRDIFQLTCIHWSAVFRVLARPSVNI